MKKIIAIIFVTQLALIGITPITNAQFLTPEEQAELQKQDLKDNDINDKVNSLFPTQSQLFDSSKRLDKNGDGKISEEEQLRLTEGDIEQGLAPRLLKILVRFSGLLIFVFITYAGLKLLLSRGNEEELTKTKDLIIQVLIGTLVILGSFAITVGILRFFDSI